MEHKGWIFVLGAAVLIAVGVVVWVNDEQAEPTPPAADHGVRSARAPADAEGGSRWGGSAAAPPPVAIDAGVLARVGGSAAPAAPTEPSEPTAGDRRRRTNQEAEVERSAGWRLGQARRRVEILQPRIERMRGLVEQLEAEGRTDLAERQRAVLDRSVRRLEEVRTEERELATQAQQDGTLGEADQGYEEGGRDRTGAGGAAARMPPPPAE